MRQEKRNTRYHKKNYKWGMELPKFIEEAYAIYAKNGNAYWYAAVVK